MAFKIQLTEAARRDIGETMDFLVNRAPAQANKWLDGLFEAMDSLGEMPARHALIPESQRLKRSLRGLPYHSHRVIYEIDEATQTVSIIRIYHSARTPLQAEDVD